MNTNIARLYGSAELTDYSGTLYLQAIAFDRDIYPPKEPVVQLYSGSQDFTRTPLMSAHT